MNFVLKMMIFAGDDWKQALDAVKLRAKIKKALLEPAMVLFWETASVFNGKILISCFEETSFPDERILNSC